MKKTPTLRGMTMRYPATRWQDALPTGSGVVGAMIYGNIQNDTILLNHDAHYYPLPGTKSLDVSDQVPTMRDLINNNKSKEAAQLMRDTYAERLKNDGEGNGSVAPYQPFCSVFLNATTDGPFQNYRRGLDFETGRAWVQYRDNAATFTREVFVSRATDTIFLRVRSNKKSSISCRLSLGKTQNEQIDKKEFTHTSAKDVKLSTSQSVSQEDQTLIFRGEYTNGLSFGAVGQLTAPGGKVCSNDNKLVIRDADEVVLQIRLFYDKKPDAAIPLLIEEFTKESTTFDTALAEHVALHAKLFNKVSFTLGKEEQKSNEEMLMTAYDGEVPQSLIQTMFDYGRYLLIASSRQGGWPSNLQGIWNGDYKPAWNCDIHTDENIQMNYWQAMPTGLGETALPLFDYFETYLDDFRNNAMNNYACRGIQVPLAMTSNGVVTPQGYANWTAGAGWIAQHFYDYYLFTNDLVFLKDRAIPWLKEVATFYEDFLYEGDDGKLVYNPSMSPENRPGNGNSLLTINATMDIAICREVLSNLCDGCTRLGIEADGVSRWSSMLERLPDYTTNEDGALAEWIHPAFDDNYHHRHQSHLYPIFPGLEITKESNPEIYEAGRIAVEKRLIIGLTSQTGWSMGHMANTYARLGQGDRSLECLDILTRGSTGPNLFTYHNDWRKMGLTCGTGEEAPFQIDANCGITAAVLEMLVFSKPGLVKLLPACPTKWTFGKVTGIVCRGAITVDMEWDTEIKTFSATLTSINDQTLRLHLPDTVGNISFSSVATARHSHWELTLTAGTPVFLTA